jgi:hypothetical protein
MTLAMIATLVFGALPLVIWLVMIFARGMFWRADVRDDRNEPPAPATWPSVTAVVPARDEADVIARSIGGLLAQDYPGKFQVILVDDQSTDGTADAAKAAARELGAEDRLTIMGGRSLPAGWTGKLWAVSQGVERAEADAPRHEIIDDCALGRRMKAQGPIWLGLTDRAQSLRPYEGVSEIGRMVSRSAYAQLGYSPLVLAGVIAGMILTYVAPPAAAIFGTGWLRIMGAATWALMTISFWPMARFYRVFPLWGLALPAIGAAYTWFTLQSAIQVWRGRGGMWKGRAQAQAGRA